MEEVEIVEYIEDHTQYDSNGEMIQIPDELENGVDLTLDDESNQDTDLDFDFTDDEKDNDEEGKEKVADLEQTLSAKTEENNEDSPEHTKMVNILLDAGVNGIESEIDCCLIDKKTLMSHEGQVSEQVTLVLKDDPPPPTDVPTRSSESPVNLPKLNPRSNTGKRVSIHESEYIVCEKCHTIYHRPLGSDTNKCLTCIKRVEKRTY